MKPSLSKKYHAPPICCQPLYATVALELVVLTFVEGLYTKIPKIIS